ncbi:unnamed protein product [Adineta ricciae]|uniref:Uncharacterized protein n=1 Tax=Adineta ricciae TaxID=249248 RepID=A0A813ZDF3_ADIRI|nr:unnamed protein product [Adineta ricciae]CAF0896898.1 unnamed protein product [Adineta ricciae]
MASIKRITTNIFDCLTSDYPCYCDTVCSGWLGSFSDHFLAAESSNVGSSHFPAVPCKLRAGNGQELIGYFLCNSDWNPAARNLLESSKTVPESRRAVPEPTQISMDPVAGMIDLELAILLFGSVIDTLGEKDGDAYIIKEILLIEQKPNGVAASSWISQFVNLDLRRLDDASPIDYTPLTNKKLRATKSSPKAFGEDLSDDDDDPILLSTD